MPVEDFRVIAKQCEGKVYQFALGGCPIVPEIVLCAEK